jgi:hypothetical protein
MFVFAALFSPSTKKRFIAPKLNELNTNVFPKNLRFSGTPEITPQKPAVFRDPG